ncbi:unnamed protein product [Caenorhabditis bovis]|uniref:G-protein coupled receptors family 1 profile domain-containing protein n=1 Tax=Caenorhabditis bovis TaxID=2654633 RepID=A0A8S1E6Z3_9PELO|nr:unnamed protein product [Caenorhabditis bovis]
MNSTGEHNVWKFDQLAPFVIFSSIHSFSLVFNAFFFLVIKQFGDRKTTPIVFIYNMILSNVMNIIGTYIGFLLPLVWTDEFYFGKQFRQNYSAFLTLFIAFSYRHQLFLSFLMIIQRFYCVLNPTTQTFTDYYLWLYSGLLMAFGALLLLIPFLSDCYMYTDQRRLKILSACEPNVHPIAKYHIKFTAYAPYISLIFTIALIFYVSAKHGKTFKNSQTSNSRILKKIRNYEKNMLIQAVSTTIFLTVYDFGGRISRFISPAFVVLTSTDIFYIFYIRAAFATLITFTVYGIATRRTRNLIITSLFWLIRGDNGKQISVVSTQIRRTSHL